MSFQTETYGKWILAGEHAVLRGSPALVFPARDYVMRFQYENSHTPLQTQFEGPFGEDLKLVFWGLLEQALVNLKRARSELFGYLKITSFLPLGAGLGASAALCVGVSRFLVHLGWLEESRVYEFSRQLEGMFHGESSGVDIAVAVANHGLKFVRAGERTKILSNWQPRLFLSYSGERGATADCVRRVNEFRRLSPVVGEQIDKQMADSVRLAERALLSGEGIGFSILAESINLARECFEMWGLTSGALDYHIQELSRAGAVAVKPTGSGGGGYVLSLWSNEPPPEVFNKLVPVR
jgi:mevalonate kinase